MYGLRVQRDTREPPAAASNSFVKRQSLFGYCDTPASTSQGTLLVNEARVCEMLKTSPHPNIAEYLGCVVEEDRLVGICFVRYQGIFADRVRAGSSAYNRASALACPGPRSP
jgi:hypothetical protein